MNEYRGYDKDDVNEAFKKRIDKQRYVRQVARALLYYHHYGDQFLTTQELTSSVKSYCLKKMDNRR